MSSAVTPALTGAQYHLLDVGAEKYGDCILCRFPSATVLIDGAHASDYQGQPGFKSIPQQLSEVLGQPSPFALSLLVVTHCHADHIGCLPDLVANGIITADWALVADESVGFGLGPDGAAPPTLAAAPDAVKRMVASLREEDHGHLQGAAFDQFQSVAANLEQRYTDMLATLAAHGTRVVRYGKDDPTALEGAFAAIGLQILGPTRPQLDTCAQAISQLTEHAAHAASEAMARGATLTDVGAYRELGQALGASAPSAPGGPGVASLGAAINDTSVCLKFAADGQTVLLYGDMQLAVPQVPGLDQPMAALLSTINAAGPYGFTKLGHHTSYTAVNATILGGWGQCHLFAHSGGCDDASHPDPTALQALSALGGSATFARTDHNGLITLVPGQGFTIAKGSLNDFTPNPAQPVGR